MILDETRERFIRAIAKQVDPERIAEIHFFSPIRQGGVESGVAVIAAIAAIVEMERQNEEAPPSETSEEPSVAEQESPYSDEGGVVVDEAPVLEDPPVEEPLVEEPLVEEPLVEEPLVEEPLLEEPLVEEPLVETPTPIERHVIYTAAYRLTLKGPDRGKWDTNVTAEADAPIITVDAVVRGVQRRSGDVDEPTRMTGDEIRTALPRGIEGLPTRA